MDIPDEKDYIPDEKDYEFINQRLSNIEQQINQSNKLKESILSALSDQNSNLNPQQIDGVITEVQNQSDNVKQMIEYASKFHYLINNSI